TMGPLGTPRRTTTDSLELSEITVRVSFGREATMRRSTLVTYALTAVLIVSYLGTSAAVKTGGYVEADLVANKPGLIDKNRITHNVQITDDNLVNPWGVAESSTSPFWVSDNGTGVATLYSVAANPDGSQVVQKFPPSSQGGPLVVRIPL